MTNSLPIVHVVDDDASFRTAVGELLSVCGYRVELADSAEQLLASSFDREPACILLDVKMAGISGPELQDRLTELGCKLPIIFITGHGDIPTSVQAIKAGAEDFLTKPVAKERLIDVIKIGPSNATKTDGNAMPGLPRYTRCFHDLRRASAKCSAYWCVASPTSRLPMPWVRRNEQSNCTGTM